MKIDSELRYNVPTIFLKFCQAYILRTKLNHNQIISL